MRYGGHPTSREIKLYVQGRVGASDRLWIAEHLGCCTNCFLSLYSARRRAGLSPARAEKREDPPRRAAS